jgi:catechol-2,3-dioxygenase
MKIRKLKLFTHKLELEKTFYAQTLGFEIIKSNSNYFTLKVGWTELTFEKAEIEYKYHYCFLIPSNKLEQAMEWMEKRVPIIVIENGRKTQRFENWNADSFYFYDASGNIAEFIVRHELDNGITSDFNISDVLCLNEIGMPTNNVEKTNNELFENFGTEFWKGDIKRFGTNGSQEGLFLLPNYEIKDIWFPTKIKIKPEPFEIQFENNGERYHMEYKNGKIITAAIEGSI